MADEKKMTPEQEADLDLGSFGTNISNFRVPGSLVRQRCPCALRCFRYSSRLPTTVFMVATMASLVISVSPLKSPNILKSGGEAHQEAMWSA